MDREQIEARLQRGLAFLKEEALGALGAIWRPFVWTFLGLTVVVTLLLAYATWHGTGSGLDFWDRMITAVMTGAYCGVFVATPIAVGNFLWRLFGWGALVTIFLAPPAFLLTTLLFSPILIELGSDLVQTFSAAYSTYGSGTLTALMPEGSLPGPTSGGVGSPEPNMGFRGAGDKVGRILLAILLIPMVVCIVIDLAYVSLTPAVLWSAAWFLGAVGLVLVLAILAALAVSVPALAYNFWRRAQRRYEEFEASDG